MSQREVKYDSNERDKKSSKQAEERVPQEAQNHVNTSDFTSYNCKMNSKLFSSCVQRAGMKPIG